MQSKFISLLLSYNFSVQYDEPISIRVLQLAQELHDDTNVTEELKLVCSVIITCDSLSVEQILLKLTEEWSRC